MNVQMASGKDLKKVKVFINKYGQVQEGSIYENMGGNVMGGTPVSNRVAEEARGNEETKEE